MVMNSLLLETDRLFARLGRGAKTRTGTRGPSAAGRGQFGLNMRWQG
jgi:hypothetical protein